MHQHFFSFHFQFLKDQRGYKAGNSDFNYRKPIPIYSVKDIQFKHLFHEYLYKKDIIINTKIIFSKFMSLLE